MSREGTVKLTAAPTVSAIRHLPGWVDEGSVRAATTAGRILDVRVGRSYLARATEQSYRKAIACWRWSVAAFVDNLTDEAYRVYAFDSSLFAGVVAGVYGKPRTYGLTASWRFGAAYQ